DGKELFYLTPDRSLVAAELKLGASVEAAAPRRLFQTRVPSLGVTHYAVAPDGQRFLIDVALEDAGPVPITVVLKLGCGHSEIVGATSIRLATRDKRSSLCVQARRRP